MRFALAALVILTMACRDTNAPPATGTIVFTMELATCRGTHQTFFVIDTSLVGPELLGPGGTSQAYRTTEGRHATRAKIENYVGDTATLWTYNDIVTVPANGSVGRLITC